MHSGIVRFIIELMRQIKLKRHDPYNFPKAELERLYTTEGLSTYSIATKWNCDPKTIYTSLLRYNIPTRPRKVVRIKANILSDLYSSGKSMADIGKLYDICPAAVHRKIHQSKILPRNQWESNIKYTRHDFSGNPEEKAYLIGFRIGDLNVRTRPDLSSGIGVKSGTTKLVQLQLMEQLFGQYGHIWISGPHGNGAYQFETKLNRSFEFLLPKHKEIPLWIMQSKDSFWNFVAGYTDAEGNIGVYSTRAKFRLRSYDRPILSQINAGFVKAGIHALIKLETKAGISRSGKTKLNHDCWGVTVNHAPSLVVLFDLLRSRLLHGKRVADLQLATSNLVERGYID